MQMSVLHETSQFEISYIAFYIDTVRHSQTEVN